MAELPRQGAAIPSAAQAIEAIRLVLTQGLGSEQDARDTLVVVGHLIERVDYAASTPNASAIDGAGVLVQAIQSGRLVARVPS